MRATSKQDWTEPPVAGGGVALYIKDTLKYTWRDDLPVKELDFICVEIEPPKSKSYLLVAWYRPPSDPVGSFKKLEANLAFLDKEGKEIILLGDTNCGLSNGPDGQLRDNNSKHICDLYGLFDLAQLIGEPTRVTLDSSTTIDHIATSYILKSGVYKVTMSDHYMVYCVRKFNGKLKKNIWTRMMKTFQKKHF